MALETPSFASSSKAGIHIQIVRSDTDWDRLQNQWRDLFDASPSAAAPLRFEWLREWWRIYGPAYGRREQSLHIITVHRGSHLIGALPLYECAPRGPSFVVRRLAFLSSCERETEETCADYLNLLYRPGEEQVCLDAIQHLLTSQDQIRWDELILDRVPASSPLLRWRDGFPPRFRAEVIPAGACALSDLSRGLEHYLRQLSPAARKECRRSLARAQRSGASFEVASDPPSVEEFFDQMIQLHQNRWHAVGKPGCFASPRFTQFHRTLARRWVPIGKAILARLSLNGQPLSVVYGTVVRGKFDCYIQGTAMHSPLVHSPGTALLLLLREHLVEVGLTVYDDLLARASSPKHRFATSSIPLVQMHIVRTGVRTALHNTSDLIHRASRKCWRLLATCAALHGHATSIISPISDTSS
ncbi:MAG: GNAT family N-acetyltransferase [Bacillota bacterium]